MSGKGNSGRSGGANKGGGSRGGGGGSSNQSQPTVVSGWEYHMYAQNSDRYVYIGKDDDGTPEFIDYGPKAGRR